jgi:chromosome segregation ATPase
MGLKAGQRKSNKNKGNQLGEFSRISAELTRMEAKIAQKIIDLESAKRTFAELEAEETEYERKAANAAKRSKYAKDRWATLSEDSRNAKSSLETVKNKSKYAIKFTHVVRKNRLKVPSTTKLYHDNPSAAIERRKEIMDCAMIIMGADKKNMEPALFGLLDTLGAKQSDANLSKSIQVSCIGVS